MRERPKPGVFKAFEDTRHIELYLLTQTSCSFFALQPLPNPTHTTHYNKALAHMAAHMAQGSWATVTPSISYWQRRLNVGYHTAVAVHAQLVADGFIHRASDDDPWRFHLPQRGA